MISRIQVGSDISKKWFDVWVLVGRVDVVQRYPNTVVGHRLFIDKVRSLGAKKVHVCMEYTGGFETAFALACKAAGFIVSIVDGAKIANFRGSFSSTGASTDKRSSYLLARFCKERRPEEWFPVPDEYRKLRELVRHRERLLESKGEWASRAAYDVEDELVGSQRRAIIEVIALQVEAVDERIAEHVNAHAALAESIRLLKTVPGVAFKSACRILGEMGPVENYASAKELALAAGLVPIVIHSGQKVPPGKLPIYGNKELRTALFYPALTCKRTGKGVGIFIDRVGATNKLKMTALVAGMRKLIHVVFGVLSSRTPFNPEFLTG
jgi:transposase